MSDAYMVSTIGAFCGISNGYPPDYLNDLNAIHFAETKLSDTSPGKDSNGDQIPSQKAQYRLNLCLVTFMKGGPIMASARHRCEAFVKTITTMQ